LLVEGCEGKFAYNQRGFEIPKPEQRRMVKIPGIDDSRKYKKEKKVESGAIIHLGRCDLCFIHLGRIPSNASFLQAIKSYD
jgi:hypothetical protein